MIKPNRLKKGDTVALVSLSSGLIGENAFLHKYTLAQKRLEEIFGVKLIAMPNSLKGIEYLYNHPEKRAEDFMNAFKDKNIKAIICAIGGDDTIRLLPYIDFDIIRNNPKIFLGYSDTTINHFMMYKAGVTSYYGPNIMCDFAEYGNMYEYTEEAIKSLLFDAETNFDMKKSSYSVNEFIEWNEKNISQFKERIPDEIGYEVIQGKEKVTGNLLGGCIDVFPMLFGTSIWPSKEEWKNKILFIETSEEKPTPQQIKYYLRGLGAQGVLNSINGILVGKPQENAYYEEYKTVLIDILNEFNLPNLPIMYNVNFGHNLPIGIIPYGIKCELDLENKKITFTENVVA